MLIRITIIIIMLILEAVELHDMSVVMPHRDATSWCHIVMPPVPPTLRDLAAARAPSSGPTYRSKPFHRDWRIPEGPPGGRAPQRPERPNTTTHTDDTTTHTHTHTKPARECKKNAYTVHLDHGAYTVQLDHGAAHGLVERVHYLRATVSASDSLAS